MDLQKIVLEKTPVFFQNILITLFNTYQYRQRQKGEYKKLFLYYSKIHLKPINDVVLDSELLLKNFLDYASNKSEWYKDFRGKSLSEYPFLEKADIVNNLEKISTIPLENGHINYTGGTTGASLKVVYTKSDRVERSAILDSFRYQHGYKLGKKTAWFSGKSIVRDKDISNGICSRSDWVNRIRFYSTFFISEHTFNVYWRDISKYSPEYIVGFPSSVYEICRMARERNLKLENSVKVFFPTAESMLEEQSECIKDVFGCDIVDQYASSEGAPFILECAMGKMHVQPYTGVFEVFDEDGKSADEGELVVTAFHTHGTPLIRYRIGDRIRMSPSGTKCKCGSPFKIVEEIIGRNTDFVKSPERGRVNLGNLSNSTKNIPSIQCFQIIQDNYESILVKIVVSADFSDKHKKKFLINLRERLGQTLKIKILVVDGISREKSGKFRIVINNLQH